jgi:hypothetical protein
MVKPSIDLQPRKAALSAPIANRQDPITIGEGLSEVIDQQRGWDVGHLIRFFADCRKDVRGGVVGIVQAGMPPIPGREKVAWVTSL